MQIKEELEAIEISLYTMIQTARSDWQIEQRRMGRSEMEQVPIETAKDMNNRPLIADLVVARANVLCALARMEKKK